MLERVGGRFVVERLHDASRVARREVADDIGQLRRMQAREALARHRQPHVRGIDVGNRRDVVPSDQRTRNAVQQVWRKPARAEPPQEAREADVGRDDTQRPAGIGDLKVVDAHDLAPVDVDDLLIEQIANQIQRFALGRSGLERFRPQNDGTLGIERDDIAERAIS